MMVSSPYSKSFLGRSDAFRNETTNSGNFDGFLDSIWLATSLASSPPYTMINCVIMMYGWLFTWKGKSNAYELVKGTGLCYVCTYKTYIIIWKNATYVHNTAPCSKFCTVRYGYYFNCQGLASWKFFTQLTVESFWILFSWYPKYYHNNIFPYNKDDGLLISVMQLVGVMSVCLW